MTFKTLFVFLLLASHELTELSVDFDPLISAIKIEGLKLKNSSSIKDAVSVYFGNVDIDTQLPSVMGNFERKGSLIFFKAKYGFSAGSSYTISINTHHLNGLEGYYTQSIIKRMIVIPKPIYPRITQVKNVYPTASELPMNQLKLYIEFSGPMQAGHSFEHIKLYRLPGLQLESEAFLQMPEELWDPEQERLTIFFDPGRIKRGVQPNQQLGLPLVAGRDYRLVIDSAWCDAHGVGLLKPFEKEFRVIDVDRISPKHDNWVVISPKIGTSNPVIINFHESMDYGLLQSALIIVDEKNQKISGNIKVSQFESHWEFNPTVPWKEGDYSIVINPWLEDLAGNNLRRKFDVDLNNPADKPKDIKEMIIQFQISLDTY